MNFCEFKVYNFNMLNLKFKYMLIWEMIMSIMMVLFVGVNMLCPYIYKTYIKRYCNIYGLETGLVPAEEKIYTTNLILDVLNLSDYEEPAEDYTNVELEPVLAEMLDYAVANELIEDSITYKDLFDTRIMNCLMP